MERVEEIISKTILLTDRLKLAIIHQDNLAKRGFVVTGKELPNTIEAFEKDYVSLENEFEVINEKLKKEKEKLAKMADEYEKMLKENCALKETENVLTNMTNPTLYERQVIAEELRSNLKIYKLLTGIRFDFKHAEDILSGYIAISQKEPFKSTCIPFQINSNNHNCSEVLWEKINEACLDVIEYQ